jgi:hypothetical protein
MAKMDAPSVIWVGAHVAIYAGALFLVIRFLSNAARKASSEAQSDEIVPPPDSPMYSQE